MHFNNCKAFPKIYKIQHKFFFFHLHVYFYCITCAYIVQAFSFKIVSNIKDWQTFRIYFYMEIKVEMISKFSS